MKKILIFGLFLFAAITFGQDFSKFEEAKDVKSYIVNKKMFEMMSKVKVDAKDKEMQQYLSLLSELDELKLFRTSNEKTEQNLKATADAYIKNKDLQSLYKGSHEGNDLLAYAKEAGENKYKDLVVIINGGKTMNNETAVLVLNGNFDMDKLNLLAEKLNLPIGDVLKKISK